MPTSEQPGHLGESTRGGGICPDRASAHAWAGTRRIYRADAAARLLSGPWYWWIVPNPQYVVAHVQWRWAHMTGTAARAFVLSTGARFVFAGCRSNPHLRGWLRPITRAVHRFGCITIYEVS